ncbi:hypothetical protein B6A10_14415 [Flavobacterium sp. L1I52]|uniref:Outer membrane protein beta-barrel domain-containing protein n=1 Tax=Flavobacterium pokkalii TaxID=1940408 RepID=A0ABR7UU78_9FLAO|nr:outer membrane beta-barrel protein [Flavobacterium pokkalii]MBD0726370.1 hypothetical protein [Flavobacterium pokkalii]
MKKIFLALSLSFIGILSAQTEKGSFIISGQTNLGFISNTIKYKAQGQTIDGPKTNTFTISPGADYFIVDNFALGLSLDFKSTTTKIKQNTNINDPYDPIYTAGENKETQTTLSIIPNATYFFSEGKTRPFLNAGVGFGNNKYKSDSNGTSSTNGVVWTANGGFIYLITPTVSIDFGLGYANYSFKNEGVTIKSGALGVQTGISVFLK